MTAITNSVRSVSVLGGKPHDGRLMKPRFEVRRSIRDRYDDHSIRILLDRHTQKSSR
jgi:hypothetical protein